MTLEDSESKDCDFCVSSGTAVGRSGHTKHSDIEHDNEAVGRGHSCTTFGISTPTAVRGWGGVGRDWRTTTSQMEAVSHCELDMTGHLQKLSWLARETEEKLLLLGRMVNTANAKQSSLLGMGWVGGNKKERL